MDKIFIIEDDSERTKWFQYNFRHCDLTIAESVAPNDEILQKFVDLLSKYSDNKTIIVNVEEGHFKFWLYEELGRNQIRYVWGKIGGTASIKDIYESKYDANQKRYLKTRKGYQEII